MSNDQHGYEKDYSEEGFWNKVVKYAKVAGKEVIEKALWLYYASQRSETPLWARSVIYGALGYLISPIDAIPDAIPVVGYADDLGALAAAVATVAMYINDEVRGLATNKIKDWFGDEPELV